MTDQIVAGITVALEALLAPIREVVCGGILA